MLTCRIGWQVGRVGGSNKIFERILSLEAAAQATSAYDEADLGSGGGRSREASNLQQELDMAKQCGEYIKTAVETWLAGKTAPISPTMPQILSVVAQAASGMPLPTRDDLLNFQNFVETDADAKAFRSPGMSVPVQAVKT